MRSIVVLWENAVAGGKVEVSNGKLKSPQNAFDLDSNGRLEITVDEENVSVGADPTIVSIIAGDRSFSFLLRDVSSSYPIYIPQYGAAVTETSDLRSYAEIAEDILSRNLLLRLKQMENEPEESFENAALATRELHGPTWLGLSRDIRIFEFDNLYHDPSGWYSPMIRARYPKHSRSLPPTPTDPSEYFFFLGRGIGCAIDSHRKLEDDILPIVHGRIADDDIVYDYVTFASLEVSPLTTETLRGTHFIVADKYSAGNMFTKDQEKLIEELEPTELQRDEEVTLYFRAEAVNTASVPRYAFFRAPLPVRVAETNYHKESGFGKVNDDDVFVVSKVNGEPMPKDEAVILLKPGESATFEFAIPHRPIDSERAERLIKQDFDVRWAECREFWLSKLEKAAKIQLPEKRIEDAIKRGLLHLDLIAYGLEPDQTVAADIGVYSPIGSESSPIIQFMDSSGWHTLAERSLQYFIDKQHDDGFIQNFNGYMLETQAALWCMGEHYRYTRDEAWVKKIKPNLLKARDYLDAWIKRNKREDLLNRGYGMIEGKVGDPEDPYHLFMLNGYVYCGLSRLAEMLKRIDPEESLKTEAMAEDVKSNIRKSLFASTAKSPVVPLGDGTWCPTVPPWAEAAAPTFLAIDDRPAWTHGMFAARDSIVGPLYLAFQEVCDPHEPIITFALNYQTDFMHVRNVAFSQPYYSRHPWVHLKRGEIKAFLKTYYNCYNGLIDRETGSFWEHFYHASPHKTHEEGWFLMETRWMLYMEEGGVLRLLPGIPRAWMEQGKRIEVKDAASYFGRISFSVISDIDHNRISAVVESCGDRAPESIIFRLPHPLGRRARAATGGEYDPASEAVIIDGFTGKAEVTLEF